MRIYYKFAGQLIFDTATAASAALEELTAPPASLFWRSEHSPKTARVHQSAAALLIEDEDYADSDEYHDTVMLLKAVAAHARGGYIDVDDGDGRGNVWNWYRITVSGLEPPLATTFSAKPA
jgi:hypothetical protein